MGCLVVYEEKRSCSFEASTSVFPRHPLLFDSPNVLEKLEERIHLNFAKVANE